MDKLLMICRLTASFFDLDGAGTKLSLQSMIPLTMSRPSSFCIGKKRLQKASRCIGCMPGDDACSD